MTNSPSELSEILKTARESNNLSLEQLSQQTKIPLQIIQNLETDQSSQLPASPYIRAFLQTLAKVLNLDYSQLLELYNPTPQVNSEPASLHVHPGKTGNKKSKIIVVFILVFLVVLFFLMIKSRNSENSWYTSGQTSDASEPLPEVEAFKTPYADSLNGDTNSAYPNPTVSGYSVPSDEFETTADHRPNPKNKKDPMAFSDVALFKCLFDSVWVGVRRVGNEDVQNLLVLGQTWKVSNKDTMHVKIGVPKGVSVILRGKPYQPLTKRFSIFDGKIVKPQ